MNTFEHIFLNTHCFSTRFGSKLANTLGFLCVKLQICSLRTIEVMTQSLLNSAYFVFGFILQILKEQGGFH